MRSTMRETETLMRVALLIVLVSHVVAPIAAGQISGFFAEVNNYAYFAYYRTTSSILYGLGNTGVAIWLYVVAKKNGAHSRLWAFFGLFFGIYTIVVFYLIRTHGLLTAKAEEGPAT